MKIELNSLPVQHLTNFNGGEKELLANLFFDGVNKILRGRLVPGASIGYHCHATSSEIIYILSGKGTVYVNEKDTGMEQAVREELSPEDCHYCPKGWYHSLVNEGQEDLVFFAVVPQQ
ncbi:MAG: cupin domain-containing protein [Clostridia bacterium]|nr:cupin domain-containing protein [Clostridia bacterium]